MIDKFYLALRIKKNSYAAHLGGATGSQRFILAKLWLSRHSVLDTESRAFKTLDSSFRWNDGLRLDQSILNVLILVHLGASPGTQSDGTKYRQNIEENMQEKNAMKPTPDALLERFRQAFSEAVIQLEDESHLHAGHAGATGGASHFRVRVIDASFKGLQHIARHRLVYDAVSDWMPERVHALNISAMTLEEAVHASTF